MAAFKAENNNENEKKNGEEIRSKAFFVIKKKHEMRQVTIGAIVAVYAKEKEDKSYAHFEREEYIAFRYFSAVCRPVCASRLALHLFSDILASVARAQRSLNFG